jgi:hypothetical protein
MQDVGKKYMKLMSKGKGMQTIWNEEIQVDMVKTSLYYIAAFVFETSFKGLGEIADQHSREVIQKFIELFAIYTIFEELPSFLATGYFVEDDIDELNDLLKERLAYGRQNSINVVESFDFRDEELNSVLGPQDGKVYERMIGAIRKNPLNKDYVPKGFNKYMRPIIRGKL